METHDRTGPTWQVPSPRVLLTADLAHPVQVEGMYGRADVESISMGESHTLFRDSQGNVRVVGNGKAQGPCPPTGSPHL